MERLSGVFGRNHERKGEIIYKDTRKYAYEKTYCDGHAAPSWANMPEDQEDGDSGDEDGKKSDAYEEAAEQTRDNNRAAAKQWMELVEPVRQRRKEAAIFTGWRMRVSTMRYRKYWKAENRMGEAEKMLEMSESSGLHPKPHLRNPAARRTVRRHTGSLSDCGLPIHGGRSRQETGISSMICTWMISLWR